MQAIVITPSKFLLLRSPPTWSRPPKARADAGPSPHLQRDCPGAPQRLHTQLPWLATPTPVSPLEGQTCLVHT